MELPQAFLQRMQEMLGEEYDEFLACYDRPALRGVRRNPLKCDEETLRSSIPCPLTPSPFSFHGFYAEGDWKPGPTPAHHAGMFYSQEPSASAPVTVLAPQPGEKILDLCAAPGGKSTQIAGLMDGKGLLWSNEIVKSRANVLLSNLERMGVRNAVASSCHPQRLCEALAGWFDRVLVDAPCSGEGMFRREPSAVSEWTPESSAACAQRQLAILDSAALAVRQGGVLVYSTCTFSREENEGVAERFLQAHPEYSPEPIQVSFGRPGLNGERNTRRIFPMDGGEGHFMACFRKTGEAPCTVSDFSGFLTGNGAKAAAELYESMFTGPCPKSLAKVGDRILIVPETLPELSGLGVLRAGVELGELRNGRIEPSHSLFMSRCRAECRAALELSPDEPMLAAFLRGEEIDYPEELSGYTAVCVNGVVTGFGKAVNGRLKNRYPKGLRERI